MASTWQYPIDRPPQDPAAGHGAPWPAPVMFGIALAGLILPLVAFIGAAVAYAFADKDQGAFLIGVGLVHVIVALTFLSGA
jgi:hypothetical protein